MHDITKTVLGLTGLAALALGGRRLVHDHRAARLADSLRTPSAGEAFDEAQVATLPKPARRYFRHALRPGTPPARSVDLRLAGRMKPRADAALVDLTAEETLAPSRGFVWTAHLRMGLLPIRVRDHYADGTGAVRVTALGLLPVGGATGPDVRRSSRHRLAAESIWVPGALLPGPHVAWSAVDDEHARLTLTIDGEAIPLTLTIDAAGRLREVVMRRYGDVGVASWQPIPYGFAVDAEQTFDGCTIPTDLHGGWWYGTDRYDPDGASRFRLLNARFHGEGL